MSSPSAQSSDDEPTGPGSQVGNPAPEASTSYAPYKSIPKAAFASIEYPSTVSHPAAILRLVNQEDINECFNAPSNEPAILEMRLGSMHRSGVPIRGSRVQSQKLLLKLTRRRRRRPEDADETGGPPKGKERERDGAEMGVFTSEVVGPIPHTVRFRAMADWKYTPQPEGRTSQLAAALRDIDYDQILAYTVPPTPEDFGEAMTPKEGENPSQPQYRSILDLQPAPVFSERRIPFIYNFRNHPSTFLDEYEDERTKEIKRRFANRSRFVAVSLQKLPHHHKPQSVPTGPPKSIASKMADLDPRILERFRQLLEQRPVWARHALLAQFNEADRRTIRLNKYYLPAVVYTFGAGPFWKTVVRFGYDPCQDRSSATLQRIYFYTHVNRQGRFNALDEDSESEEENSKGHLEWEAEQKRLVEEGRRPPLDPTQEHIFDGKLLHRDRPDFQLCDITDPLIRRIIEDPKNLRDVCDPRSGWYEPSALEHIKQLTRLKFFYVRENNAPAPDEICHVTMVEYAKSLMRQSERGVKKNEGEEPAERDDGESARSEGVVDDGDVEMAE
ncbi:RNA polymerase III transcription factor IIIC subunit-domain-containing protein [Papiliotrema laurentii]|uniref:RNA polymerase III transcription factor IIIC subunit-domain-containing protein n=1 Tax=Papiliotrema laurentii TaxID=5418 RepID=A0AAD9L704_PAPLA|nr:RNA polymerase III transcription factor IIIC subunit-domain-containing protein [Papiliotrema laurentii]